jgi:hypothetical protein
MSADDVSSPKSNEGWKKYTAISFSWRKSVSFLRFFVLLLLVVSSQGFCRLPFSRLPTWIAYRKEFLEVVQDLQKVMPGKTTHEMLPVAGYFVKTICKLGTNHLTSVIKRDNLLERMDEQKHYYLKQVAVVSQKAVLEELCQSFVILFHNNEKFRDLVTKQEITKRMRLSKIYEVLLQPEVRVQCCGILWKSLRM